MGDSLWIIAERGSSRDYVRNISVEPRVRVRIRHGVRYRWVTGLATVLPDDDPLVRQGRIVHWHPLRASKPMHVRAVGADLLTVHIHVGESTPAPGATVPPQAVTTGTEMHRVPALPAALEG